MREKSSKLERKSLDSYIGKDIVLAVKYDYSEIIATGKNRSEAQKNAKAKGFECGDIVLQDMKNVIDFEKVFGPYIGKDVFLAVKRDYSEVIATGTDPLEARENAIKVGYARPILMIAPDEYFGRYVLAAT